jgi:hypothetical protein
MLENRCQVAMIVFKAGSGEKAFFSKHQNGMVKAAYL